MLAKSLLYTQLFCFAFMLVGMFGHKFEILPFRPAFLGFALAVLVSLVVFLVSFGAYVFSVVKGGESSNTAYLLDAGLAVVPVIAMVLLVGKGFSAPKIHDVATVTDGSLRFVHTVTLRKPSENSIDPPVDAVVALQKKHYPNLSPIQSALSKPDAFSRCMSVIEQLGWEISDQSKEEGRIEAIEETRLFGFKDDILIRVMETESGSQIDLRSVSRVGVSDLGANAKRIDRFKESFAATNN